VASPNHGRVAVRDKPRKDAFEVPVHGGVRILIDDQRDAGVMGEIPHGVAGRPRAG
jgi:hypothetical protein